MTKTIESPAEQFEECLDKCLDAPVTDDKRRRAIGAAYKAYFHFPQPGKDGNYDAHAAFTHAISVYERVMEEK